MSVQVYDGDGVRVKKALSIVDIADLQCFSFQVNPVIQKPLTLIGVSKPSIGLLEFWQEMLLDDYKIVVLHLAIIHLPPGTITREPGAHHYRTILKDVEIENVVFIKDDRTNVLVELGEYRKRY